MIRLSLSVTTDDQQVVARTAEHFARTAAGLALDDVTCFVLIGPDDDDEDAS